VLEADVFVHESASVEEGAVIGAGTKVWHQAHVRSGASVGAGSVLGKNVFVDADVTIGDRCKVQNNVSVYSGVTIGDDVFVGPSATFTNDLVPRAFNVNWTRTETTVRRGASLGANSTIVCGVVLDEYCMVAAGAVVTRDVRAHSLVVGNPARHRAWVCSCGNVVSRSDDPPTVLWCADCGPAGHG
jgi:acetyltransferase-like isoleucine patch superfamily enzyme